MYLVITRVALKPGAEGKVAALFEQTNPDLVRAHPDWLGADMAFDPDTGTMSVIARWRRREGYEALAGSKAFGKVMAGFAPHFAGPPQVSIAKLLVHMPADSVAI